MEWSNMQLHFGGMEDLPPFYQRVLKWTEEFGLISAKSGEFLFPKRKGMVIEAVRELNKMGFLANGDINNQNKRISVYTRFPSAAGDDQEILWKLALEYALAMIFRCTSFFQWRSGRVKIGGREWEVLPVLGTTHRPVTGEPLWVLEDWELGQKLVERFDGAASTNDLLRSGIVMRWENGTWKTQSLVG